MHEKRATETARVRVMATILCATADDYVTDLLRYALLREGYQVRLARTGRDALRMLRLNRVDLLMLDDDLPDMDGAAVLSTLRAFSRVPVMLLVASSQEAAVADRAPGADAYMAKPFSVNIVVGRVTAVLHRTGGNGGADETGQ